MALNNLMKTLTKQEKRYFKKHAATFKSEGAYVTLFDYLNAHPNATNTEVKLSFQNEKWANNLPVIKNQLYHLILRTLRSYNEQKNDYFTVLNLIKETQVLMDKRLLKQAEKTNVRALKLAQSLELSNLQLEIMEQSLKIVGATNYSSYAPVRMLAEVEQQQEATEQSQRSYYNRHKMSQIFHEFCIQGRARSVEQLAMYNEIVSTMHQPMAEDAFRIHFTYHSACAFVASLNNDHGTAAQHFEQIVVRFEGQQVYLKNYAENCISTYNNLCFAYGELGRYWEAHATADKLEQLGEHEFIRRNTRTETLLLKDFLAVKMYLLQKENKDAELLDTLKHPVENYLKRPDPFGWYHAYFIYNMGYASFWLGNYSDALMWLKRMEVGESSGLAADIYGFEKLLRAVVLLEHNDWDTFHYLLRNTVYFLEKKGRMFEVESLLVKFLKQVDHDPHVFNHQAQLKATYNSIETLVQTNAFEREALAFFDVLRWLKGKLKTG